MAVFTDGTTMAQLSEPDDCQLRTHCLIRTARVLRLAQLTGATKTLPFEPPDSGTFKCLGLAYTAGQLGGLPRHG